MIFSLVFTPLREPPPSNAGHAIAALPLGLDPDVDIARAGAVLVAELVEVLDCPDEQAAKSSEQRRNTEKPDVIRKPRLYRKSIQSPESPYKSVQALHSILSDHLAFVMIYVKL